MVDKRLPNMEMDYYNGESEYIKWSVGHVQGWRPMQEDTHISETDIVPGISLFCVFDGHGGPEVAEYCRDHFKDTLIEHEKFKDGSDYQKAIHDTCLAMDAQMLQPKGLEEVYMARVDINRKEKNVDYEAVCSDKDTGRLYRMLPDAGCTANICLIINGKKIICGNVGDSRAVLCVNGKQHAISTDHKPTDEVESKRIKDAGGYIQDGRVMMKLAVARAIGDLTMKTNHDIEQEKQIICAVPDFVEYDISDVKKTPFLVMGCDGIWEKESANDDNIRQVKWNYKEKDWKEILKERVFDRIVAKDGKQLEGTDNMTCIICSFKKGIKEGGGEEKKEEEKK